MHIILLGSHAPGSGHEYDIEKHHQKAINDERAKIQGKRFGEVSQTSSSEV
jgi:hypothetical protein